MKIVTVKAFNLPATIESGQIFRWDFADGWYYITVGTAILKIRQKSNEISYTSSNKFDVGNFFDLKNRNYNSILVEISKNSGLARKAIAKYSGLRIINQAPWECTASFICSSFSNIKRIKANLNAIAKTYGRKIEFDGYVSYSFPTAALIAKNPKKLSKCGLGYRAKYLAETAKTISSGFNFHAIRKTGYADAKQRVMELAGVGQKVADCILLFSLGYSEAFPVDVWVDRIIRSHFSGTAKATSKSLSEFGRLTFGKNAGYAQQFLYHYARNKPNM